MKTIEIQAQKNLKLTAKLPGDKSVSHRSAMFAALAKGTSRIRNFLSSEDCLNTIKIFKAMGVSIKSTGKDAFVVQGKGLRSLKKPRGPLWCGNSGTTMRLMSGIVAGQPFEVKMTGDPSLSGRPMNRVALPLRQMGAKIEGQGEKITAPLTVRGGNLTPIDYKSPVASAQVKSAVLLAGLFATGETSVEEPALSRDHTERFFKTCGIRMKQGPGKRIAVKGGQEPKPFTIDVPGDPSSAAFLIAMALLVPGSKVRLTNVLWNPTRIGAIKVLRRMGGRIRLLSLKKRHPESIADIEITTSKLKATEIKSDEVPSLIDELPILMVLATQARGKSWCRGVEELRVKETDRVASIVNQLQRMGAKIGEKGNDVWIEGPARLEGAVVESYGDHRTAMSFIVAGMVAAGHTRVQNIDCIATSFPTFLQLIKKAGVRYTLASKNSVQP